jgi:hypothetical protein
MFWHPNFTGLARRIEFFLSVSNHEYLTANKAVDQIYNDCEIYK